jgi:23S rRNA pseudouridine2605 synthase
MARRPGQVSLDRALSKLGAASRTEARALIAAGRVRVNGRVASDPSLPVVPETARLTIDGRGVRRDAWRLIAFHKPRGIVTTHRDPEGRQTVFDVLGDAGRGLAAVGRLDRASSGLLLFTNDTQLANQLTDPDAGLTRRYLVTVRGRVGDDNARVIEEGLEVPAGDGRREQLHASRVTIRKASHRETHLIVELTEGKNRELRRLFDAVGHEVTRLHRVAFGSIELGELAAGSWREIKREEITRQERS